jgi:glyoxylase-like metal-dependent hydrolase (beta-lactamase superfamily II)
MPTAAQSWCDHAPRDAYAALERVPTGDPWFEVYRLEDGIFAIYEPYQAQEVISYLITGTDSALLFDTGMGIARISATVRRLTKLPVTVFNSHTHYDHVGGNAEFGDILAMDTEFTRESTRGLGSGAVADEVTPDNLCLTQVPRGFDPSTYAIRPFRPTQWIKGGHVIDLGGRRLEVLSAPGHTPDAVVLLDRANGLLWTGDTFYEGPIWLFASGTDLDAYEASVAMLAGLAPSLRMLLPAHNTPTAAPSRLAELRAAFAKVRDGSAPSMPRDRGRVEYLFEGFSFIMRRPR